MTYRVTIKHGWHELHFDFNRGTTHGEPDRYAIAFMQQAVKTFVQDPDNKDKEFSVTMEINKDEEDEQEVF